MHSREAYEAICAAIEADPRKRILNRRYDEQRFGSFAVSFDHDTEARCIVNDRGFVFTTKGHDGTGEATSSIPSLRIEETNNLLKALNLG